MRGAIMRYVLTMIFICVTLQIQAHRFPINTTLVVIEETENEFEQNKEQTPFSEGVFRGMWETELIFFDMRVDAPIPMVNKNLDIRPYLEDAKASGADSLLILKLAYTLNEEKGKQYIEIEEIPYIVYSLGRAQTLTAGAKRIKKRQQVENASKNHLLNKLGEEIVGDIFK